MHGQDFFLYGNLYLSLHYVPSFVKDKKIVPIWQATFFASHLHKSSEFYNAIAANLPKRLLSNSARIEVETEVKKTQKTGKEKAKDGPVTHQVFTIKSFDLRFVDFIIKTAH